MFDTWGPYTCSSPKAEDIDALWDQFGSNPALRVEHGVGIYVIGVQRTDGRIEPWYVGQTYNSFGGRLKQHFERGRFASLFPKGPLKILLIARANKGRIVRKQSGFQEKLDRKFIDWLEVDLIDKCRLVNPELLNRQFVRFLNSIWVGGYRGEGALDTKALDEYPAYRHLAQLLKLEATRSSESL